MYNRANATSKYPAHPQTQEYYLRDASGNIMTNYIRTNTPVVVGTQTTWQSQIAVADQPLYGSDRLGIYKQANLIKYDNSLDNLNAYNYPYANTLRNNRQLCYRTIGLRRYELKDHLGNVHTNFSDILLAKTLGINCATPTANCPFVYTGLQAHQTSLYNYYTFGMPKPNHKNANNIATATNWLEETKNSYRFGFNGQEKDNELKGTGNSLSYKYRMADTRLCRFFAVDPITKKYPELTPYQMTSLNPIWMIELEGLEGKTTTNLNGTVIQQDHTWDGTPPNNQENNPYSPQNPESAISIGAVLKLSKVSLSTSTDGNTSLTIPLPVVETSIGLKYKPEVQGDEVIDNTGSFIRSTYTRTVDNNPIETVLLQMSPFNVTTTENFRMVRSNTNISGYETYNEKITEYTASVKVGELVLQVRTAYEIDGKIHDESYRYILNVSVNLTKDSEVGGKAKGSFISNWSKSPNWIKVLNKPLMTIPPKGVINISY